MIWMAGMACLPYRLAVGSFSEGHVLRSVKWYCPKMGGPQYTSQITILLIMEPPQNGTPNFGKPSCAKECQIFIRLFRISLFMLISGE